MRRRVVAALAGALAPALLAGRGGAQDTTFVGCAGQRIDSIVVRTSAPTVAMLRRVPIIAHMAAAVHTTTRKQLIRRFLLLRPGDQCLELRRAESERIIRAQPFIADASVRVIADSSGGVYLDVQTADEVAIILDASAAAGNPPIRVFRIGDANLSGEGLYFSGDWRDGGAFRDGFGFRFADSQLFGRPYTFSAEGHQYPLGDFWNVSAAHPFYTDIQRISWIGDIGARDDWVQYQINKDSSHALPLTRNYFDVGGIVRVGAPGRLSLFGASISGDDERPGAVPQLITNDGFAPDTSTLLLNRFQDHRIARVNLLWGVRDIGFVRVHGFDALTATQDLPIGFQIGTIFGRSLSVLGSRDDDIFMAGDIYIGAGRSNLGLRTQLEGEGRRDNDANDWDGILASGRSVAYFLPTPVNTITASVEFGVGWNQRIPFNLTLSDYTGGLRGYGGSHVPGGERFVTRLDDRQYLGQPFKLADMGIGLFGEAGRLWAGDIPYGVNTPIVTSVGLSLYAAVPPSSARVWRLDVSFPLNRQIANGRIEFRLSNTDKTTFFIAEPSDISATREQTVPSSVFRWPR